MTRKKYLWQLALFASIFSIEIVAGAVWFHSVKNERIERILKMQEKTESEDDFWCLLKLEQLERVRAVAGILGKPEFKSKIIEQQDAIYRLALDFRKDRKWTSYEKDRLALEVKNNINTLLEEIK